MARSAQPIGKRVLAPSKPIPLANSSISLLPTARQTELLLTVIRRSGLASTEALNDLPEF